MLLILFLSVVNPDTHFDRRGGPCSPPSACAACVVCICGLALNGMHHKNLGKVQGGVVY